MARTVEKGQIFYFYRSKIGRQDKEIRGRNDVQRLFMVLAPDDSEKSRLLLVGRKRMPDIIKGESQSTEREWVMIEAVKKSSALGKSLGPEQYQTETKGERTIGEAIPAAAGRYAIVEKDDATRLIQKIRTPSEGSKAMEELAIESEAQYIFSVRNPDVSVRGFPDKKPNYPKRLSKQFADMRWLPITDADFLNYEKAQCVLIGAAKDIEGHKSKLEGKVNLWKELDLKQDLWPQETLEKGRFTTPQLLKTPHKPKGDRTRGGKKGGRSAARTDSAAGITRSLKGIEFPQDRGGLIRQAKSNEAGSEIVGVLKDLPQGTFRSMADVTKALGKVR